MSEAGSAGSLGEQTTWIDRRRLTLFRNQRRSPPMANNPKATAPSGPGIPTRPHGTAAIFMKIGGTEMAANVLVKYGDLFEGASDVIALPFSTGGTCTSFVRERLSRFDIPRPPAHAMLGDVHFTPLTGAEQIAQYVAFACSVQSHASDATAIRRIGAQLGEFSKAKAGARVFHAPLLGAGAGGIQSERVIEAIRDGFRSTAVETASLIIHILHKDVYERVLKGMAPASNETKAIPKGSAGPLRVFFSYTRTSDEHQAWVLALATYLRSNGVEARIDQWHLRVSMDLPQFMSNELSLADRVVIVCNEEYAARADGRHGGVGWETMLIQGDMMSRGTEGGRYITIARGDKVETCVPAYLRTKYALAWPRGASEAQLRQSLLKELLDIVVVPPIGTPPMFLS